MVLLRGWIQNGIYGIRGMPQTELVSGRATLAKAFLSLMSYLVFTTLISEVPKYTTHPPWRKGVWKTGLNVETVWRLGNLDWQVIQMCLKTKGIFGNFQVQGATPTLQQLLFGCHEGWRANVFRAQNAPFQKASKAEIRQLPWAMKSWWNSGTFKPSGQGNDWMDTSHLVTWYFHPSKTLKNDPGLEN